LRAKWQQNFGYAAEAPISKHQITNNIQIPISNDQRICFGFWSFGDWKLFGIWDLDFGILTPV
jgi:hypothetical protein